MVLQLAKTKMCGQRASAFRCFASEVAEREYLFTLQVQLLREGEVLFGDLQAWRNSKFACPLSMQGLGRFA